MLKERSTYEIMTPESIGPARHSRIVIWASTPGATPSGTALSKLGYELDDDEFSAPSAPSRSWRTRRRTVTDGDVEAVVGRRGARPWRRPARSGVPAGDLRRLGDVPTATVRAAASPDGETRRGRCHRRRPGGRRLPGHHAPGGHPEPAVGVHRASPSAAGIDAHRRGLGAGGVGRGHVHRRERARTSSVARRRPTSTR